MGVTPAVLLVEHDRPRLPRKAEALLDPVHRLLEGGLRQPRGLGRIERQQEQLLGAPCAQAHCLRLTEGTGQIVRRKAAQ
ncbi:MAG: hypothetical protein BGO81_05410 [Devosia sp. 66-22]|nr:MAG: hypothetical protein BGO81_05410 [Devosia sp. 66-22]